MTNKIIYPVKDKDIPFGIYHPDPYFGDGDVWQNKNRKPFDHNFTSQLMLEHINSDGYEPAQYRMLLLEYDPSNESYYKLPDNEEVTIYDNTNEMRTTWIIGKILKLGRGCFASDRFPLGAEATVGDWIQFSIANGERMRMKGVPLINVEDVNFKGLIRDPREFTNA